MKIEIPDETGANVIVLSMIRENRLLRQFKKRCVHSKTTIDTNLAELTCDDCGAKLNPIEWLAQLVEQWDSFKRLRDSYIEAKKALDAKQRCKCQHCNKFTRWKA